MHIDQVYKNNAVLEYMGPYPLSRPYPFKFFKGCLPQILLGPFLNTCSYLLVVIYCCLERDNNKDLKIHMNNLSYFEISASLQ